MVLFEPIEGMAGVFSHMARTTVCVIYTRIENILNMSTISLISVK
jgi:hypothetical protein